MAGYRYEPFVDRRSGTIADLLLRRGDIAARQAETIGNANARAAEQRGNAWAGAFQGIGNAVAAIPQQIEKQQVAQLEKRKVTNDVNEQDRAIGARSALAKVMQDTPKLSEDGVSVWDVPSITRAMADQGFGPEAGAAAQHLDGINNAFRQTRQTQLALMKQGAEAVAAAGNDQTLALHFLDQLETNQTYPKDKVNEFRDFVKADPGNTAKLTAYLMGPQKPIVLNEGATAVNPITGATVAKGAPKPVRPLTVAPGSTAINPETGQPVYTAPAAPASLQPKSVLLDGKPAEVAFNPKTNTYHLPGTNEDVSTRVKPIPPASTQVNVTQQGDADSIADAIVDGSQPPDVKGLYRLAGPVRAALARKGYDLTKANLDWEATKKHLATLNGSKITSLRSSISTASDSLDVIDSLAGQWNEARIIKDGKLIPLNKLELSAAKNGIYGAKAASIATQLEGQITDVVSELGQVYMGGNSPTDHALALAEKNLKADWSAQTLKDMTKLARTNLRIRNNSIINSGAVLSGGPETPKNETSTIPDNVGAVLRGQKPGRYTLSDGSVWTIGPDGIVAKGKP